jgi:hypothetical protein
MSEFYKYFKENMASLGLPAPESLYGTYQAAVATILEMGGVIKKVGATTTLAEIVGAGTRLEKLVVIGSLSTCYYIGAVIGSVAVATGRTLSGGASISDVLWEITRNNISIPGLIAHLQAYPSIYNGKGHPSYRSSAFLAGKYMQSAKAIA